MAVNNNYNINLEYCPGGKTLKRFHESNARFRGIMGPVGSGKTTSCLMEFILRAIKQQPIDGVRKTRWMVIKDSYRNIENTVLKTWLELFPKNIGEFRGGSSGEPPTHRLEFQIPDKTIVNTEILFRAIGDHSIEEMLRGLEVTGFYLNEYDLLPSNMLDVLVGRLDRYPKKSRDGVGATWSGIWADFNANLIDNHTYDNFVKNISPQTDFFTQPSGVSANVENLQNHNNPDYYKNQIAIMSKREADRLVRNQWQTTGYDNPVFPEYNDTIHLSQTLSYNKNLDLICGMDAGRTPAAVFIQLDHEGQIRVVSEYLADNCGAIEFGKRLRDYINRTFEKAKIQFYADPAAANPTETSDMENSSWIEIVQGQLHSRVKPAPTNKLAFRVDVISSHLSRMITGTKPALIVSNDCPMVRTGLVGGYKFIKQKSGYIDDRPSKNEYSHPMDALQYACLGAVGHTGMNTMRGRPKTKRDIIPYQNSNPFNPMVNRYG